MITDWEDIRKGCLDLEYWPNPQDKPEFYDEFVKEFKADIKQLDKKIKFWSERIINNRGDSGIKRNCKEIIKVLIQEKEKILCKIKTFSNIGAKLRESLKDEPKEEILNTQQV